MESPDCKLPPPVLLKFVGVPAIMIIDPYEATELIQLPILYQDADKCVDVWLVSFRLESFSVALACLTQGWSVMDGVLECQGLARVCVRGACVSCVCLA